MEFSSSGFRQAFFKIGAYRIRSPTVAQTADASGPKHLQKQLTRAKLEQMIRPLVDRTMEPLKRALEDAMQSPLTLSPDTLDAAQTNLSQSQK